MTKINASFCIVILKETSIVTNSSTTIYSGVFLGYYNRVFYCTKFWGNNCTSDTIAL